MKHKLEAVLKQEFSQRIKEERKQRKYTQAEMAEYLALSERAYSNLERGKSAGNALTIVLYLIRSEEANAFLTKMAKEFDRIHDSEDL